MQHQVDSISKNTCSLPLVISNKKAANSKKRHSWDHFTGAVAYGQLSFDAAQERSDLQETPFVSSMAQGEDGESVHGSNTQEKTNCKDTCTTEDASNVYDSSITQRSSGDHPERYATNGKLRKIYVSLKGATDNTYTKPYADSSRLECTANGEETVMECDERQTGKSSQEKRKDQTDEDDHEYLVVIHSDEAAGLSEGVENGAYADEDESLYLIPTEAKSEEKRFRNEGPGAGKISDGRVKADDVCKNVGSVSSLDNQEEHKYKYLSSKHAGKLTTFGHNAVSDFQYSHAGEKLKRSEMSKSDDEDGYGYLLVQHVEDAAANGDKAGSNVPVDRSQSGGIPESGGPVDPSYGDENSYDYITPLEVKGWSGSPDSDAFRLQKNNATGEAEPGTESSTEVNHEYLTIVNERKENNSENGAEHDVETSTVYCDNYLTVIHERENDAKGSKDPYSTENTTDQIYADVHDNNNNNDNAVARLEAIYVNQEMVSNAGAGAGVGYPDDVPVYANSEVQQESSMCDDNPFCYSESSIYDNNDIMNV